MTSTCSFIGRVSSPLHWDLQHMLRGAYVGFPPTNTCYKCEKMVAPKEIEQMRRPKHHLETIPICNRRQPITNFSLSHTWPGAAPQPPAPDFMECLRCNSSLLPQVH